MVSSQSSINTVNFGRSTLDVGVGAVLAICGVLFCICECFELYQAARRAAEGGRENLRDQRAILYSQVYDVLYGTTGNRSSGKSSRHSFGEKVDWRECGSTRAAFLTSFLEMTEDREDTTSGEYKVGRTLPSPKKLRAPSFLLVPKRRCCPCMYEAVLPCAMQVKSRQNRPIRMIRHRRLNLHPAPFVDSMLTL
jgi:hypothetical protein